MRLTRLSRFFKIGLFIAGLGMLYVATNKFQLTELTDQNIPIDVRNIEPQPAVQSDLFEDTLVDTIVKTTTVVVVPNEDKLEEINPSSEEATNYSSTTAWQGVRGFVNEIYLFSAVLANASKPDYPHESIVIQGLESTKHEKGPVQCCMKYSKGNVVKVNVTRRAQWTADPKAELVAKQYFCPIKQKSKPFAVTLTGVKTKCHNNFESYLSVHHTEAHKKEIGVCTKLVKRNLDSGDILTWFEINLRLGVDRFIVYTYNLDDEATKVLRHYEAEGKLETHRFSLPKLSEGEYGSKEFELWNIEQMLVYDCFQRFRGYKYIMVLDIDEYLIPKTVKKLPALFVKLWKDNPSSAGFSFPVYLHVTDWRPSNRLSELIVGKYIKRTRAVQSRMRNVARPDRLKVGGLLTYSFIPKENFVRVHADEAEATIHHFRSCDKSTDWQKEMDKKCKEMDQLLDTSVAEILKPLVKNISGLKIDIRNTQLG